MLNSKQKLAFAIVYIIVSLSLFFFISYELKHDPIKITKKEEKTQVIKYPLVKVSVVGVQETLVREVFSDKTAFEVLDGLRNNKEVSFEITRHTNKIVIDHVNNTPAKAGFRWALFENNTDITNDMDTHTVREGAVYSFKLIQI